MFSFFLFKSDLMDDTAATKYGILSITPPSTRHSRYHLRKTSTTLNTTTSNPPVGLSFSNPVYELSNPTVSDNNLDGLTNIPATIPTSSSTPPLTASSDTLPNVAFKVEHVLAPGCSDGSYRFGNFRSGLESRWRVAHAIYPYMVCIALAYCVTLSLYPGIESEIISCSLDTWMPVLLMFTFNTCDVIGKVSTSRKFFLRNTLMPTCLFCADNGIVSVSLVTSPTHLTVNNANCTSTVTIVMLCTTFASNNRWRNASIHLYGCLRYN